MSIQHLQTSVYSLGFVWSFILQILGNNTIQNNMIVDAPYVTSESVARDDVNRLPSVNAPMVWKSLS